MTDVKATDSPNHGKFAQLAGIAPQLSAVLEMGVGAKAGAEPAVGDTLGAVISLPGLIIGAPIKIIAGR